MQIAVWDSLVNLVLLVFWLRLWTRTGDRQTVFNHYLAPLDQASSAIIGFLRPICLGAPVQTVAAVVIVAIIALRGLAVPEHAIWFVTLGFDRLADTAHVGTRMAFSALSFGVCLFKLEVIAILYAAGRSRVVSDQPATALAYLARPLSLIHAEWRPLALFFFGILLAAGLDVFGLFIQRSTIASVPAIIEWQTSAPIVTALKLAILTLAAGVQVLPVLQSILYLLIVGSWVSMFTGSHGLALLCQEWITLLLGPLRSYPLRIGMFDLTPIVFAVALGFVSNWLLQLLYMALRTLA
jgi:uncharacterized protein YggT (Ycf19 family)